MLGDFLEQSETGKFIIFGNGIYRRRKNKISDFKCWNR